MVDPVKRPSLFDALSQEEAKNQAAPIQQKPTQPLGQALEQESKQSFEAQYPSSWTITRPPQQERDLSMSEMGSQALQNAPGSAMRALVAATAPIHSPIETAKSVYGLGKGVASKVGVIPGQSAAEKEEAEKLFDAMIESYKSRYGSLKDIKQTFAEDPAGVLMDLSLPFTIGGAGLGRVAGNVGRAGKYINKAGQILDPLSSIPTVVGSIPGVKKGLGAAANYALAPLESRAGVVPGSLATAAAAGRTGDSAYDSFLAQMRGTAKPTDIVAETEDTLRLIAKQNKENYLAGMRQPLTQKIVDLTPIRKLVTQKMADTSHLPSGVEMQKIQKALDDFETKGIIQGYQGGKGYRVADPMNPTIADVDKLKQHISELIDDPTVPGGAAASEVASNISKEIRKVDSGYADIMDKYGETLDQLRRFRAIAGKSGQIPEERLAKMMKGAKDKYKGSIFEELSNVNPALAMAIKGQSLTNKQKINLLEMIATGGGTYYMTQHPYLALGAMAADVGSKNPKLLGQTAYKSGQLARALEKASSSGVMPAVAPIGYLQMREELEKEKQKELEARRPFEVTVPVGVQPQRANGGRVERAAGGRIAVLRGVRALMQAAENAKKSISKSTEPLLDQPDENIAQALHVAKKNI